MAHLLRGLKKGASAALLAAALALPLAPAWGQTCPQQVINAQVGTTYTVLNSDNCKKVSFSNGSAVAVTLPQATSTENFRATWSSTLVNLGAGNVTITPATSTIDGRATILLQQGGAITLTSNGTNYVSSGIFPALSTSGLVDPDNLPIASTGNNGAVRPGTCLNMSGTNNRVIGVTADCVPLSDLSDVTITTPSATQVLAYNGSAWVNTAASSGPSAYTINAQTGTSYTVVQSDLGKIVTISNAGATAITLPQAGSGGNFTSGWWTLIENLSTSAAAGGNVITPTTSTINGAANLTFSQGQKWFIYSDGTNYRAWPWSVVYMPLGSGSVGLRVAGFDSTTVVGNDPGSRAVDLSLARGSATQVASGEASSLLGGVSNTASGQYSVVVGGNSNTASQTATGILGGAAHTVSGSYSAAAGGDTNTVSGQYSFAAGGKGNTAAGPYSIVSGYGTTDNSRYAVNCQGAGTEGNASPRGFTCTQTWYRKTTATTQVQLSFDPTGATVVNGTTMGLADSQAMIADISCVGRDATNGTDAVAASVRDLLVLRGAGAASTSFPGTPAVFANTTGTATGLTTTWALTADTTNGSISLKVTPPNTNSWTWVCGVTATTTNQ